MTAHQTGENVLEFFTLFEGNLVLNRSAAV